MARPSASVALIGLGLLVGSAAPAATAEEPAPGPMLPSLGGRRAAEPMILGPSAECRVPLSRLYALAPLPAVRKAVQERGTLRILAIGSSSTVGVGASSPLANYPNRLEEELRRTFPGVEVQVENRGISGEIAADAAERMRNTIAEVEPDLVIWQVGTNDALARVDVAVFSEAVGETVLWIKSHGMDVILVDPQYTKSLDRDEYYQSIVGAVQEIARRDRVPLVRRYEAMRFLAQKRAAARYLAKDQLHLNDLGYRCMAEHAASTVTAALEQTEDPAPAPPEPPAPRSDPPPPPPVSNE